MELLHDLIGLFPFDWAQYDFMKNALIAILVCCPLFAMLGTLVINNQMSFFSESIGHSALTGIAIGTIAGMTDPFWAMMIYSTLLAVLIMQLRRTSNASMDTIISSIMSFSVALGIVILSRNGGFSKFTNYLVGDILTITHADILRLFVLFIVVCTFWALMFNRLFTTSLCSSLARSRGINIWLIETIFAVMVALSVTATLPWIGLLVINSMIIIPAATSRNLSSNLFQYFWIAIIISLVSGAAGLIISYYANTAAGATIVLISMGFFTISALIRKTS